MYVYIPVRTTTTTKKPTRTCITAFFIRRKSVVVTIAYAVFITPLPHARFLSDVLLTQKVSSSFRPIKMNDDHTVVRSVAQKKKKKLMLDDVGWIL